MKAIAGTFRKGLYLLCGVVATGIYVSQQLELPLQGWVNNYVNDFLCLPLVLGCLTQMVRWIKKDPDFHFPFLFILCLATYYFFFFEVYLPGTTDRYTADWLDVILYFLGGFCYFVVSRSVFEFRILNHFCPVKSKP